MEILSNINSGHTLFDHEENHDRLTECYRNLNERNIKIKFFKTCKDTDIEEYISSDFQQYMKNYTFKCPKCNTKTFKRCISCGEIPFCDLSEDTYMTPYTYEVMKGVIGCIKYSVESISSGTRISYLLLRPPGHHAADSPSGFCFLNNAYVMARELMKNRFRKVGILDWDFHHGNGTQDLVEDDENIYFCSIHGYGRGVYPGTGGEDGNNENILNIPINLNRISRRQVDNEYYLSYIRGVVYQFFSGKIDALIISHGLDAHKDDSLAGMNLNDDFYVEASRILLGLGVPIVYILEGGYNPTVISNVTLRLYDFYSDLSSQNHLSSFSPKL